MKRIYPEYYSHFKCIADKCTDNCCIGWEIDIDEDTYKKYASVNDDYLKTKVQQKIKYNGENYYFLLDNERCPFLDENNLCEIIQIMGENYLCEICDNHPRFYNYYNDFYEVGVGLSCPEANRLILSKEYSDTLIYDDVLDTDIELLSDIDKLLFKFRNICFDVIDNNQFNLFEKINIILYLSYEVQEMVDNNKFDIPIFDLENIKKEVHFDLDKSELKELLETIFEIYLLLEILDDNWKNMLLKEQSNIDKLMDCKFNTEEYKINKAIKYFLFRYVISAREDGDVVSKIQLSIVSVMMILIMSSQFYNFDEVARMYSKEIDYSDINAFDLQQNFIFCDVFCEKQFKQITKLLLNLW